MPAYSVEAKSEERKPYTLPSTPPPGCPFPPSSEIKGVSFTGRWANYTLADTWYPSWGRDGEMVSAFTDGVGENWGTARSGCGAESVIGVGRIDGDDPMALTIHDLGRVPGSALPYGGRYPCGGLNHNGIWYQGTYALQDAAQPNKFNWPVLQGFLGFHVSKDGGLTWDLSPHNGDTPMFGEHREPLHEPLKIGVPHFVDFGRNMEHSPDGYAYLVTQGASQGGPGRRKNFLSWINADEAYLARVRPGLETMNDPAAYEFFAGSGRWSSALSEARPIAAWPENMGCVTITYNASLKKYFMLVTDGTITIKDFNTYLLESDSVTGPWRMVSYWERFGPTAYFFNIPSKFISPDGRTFWMCYSANFDDAEARTNPLAGSPIGSCYSMVLVECTLDL